MDFVLEKCRIEPYFDARISGDMVSRCKPDPEIYLTAAAALGPVSYTHLDVYKRQGYLLVRSYL